MRAEELLESYKRNAERLEQLEKQEKILFDKYSYQGINYGGITGPGEGGVRHPVADLCDKLDSIREEIKKTKIKTIESLEEIQKLIDGVKDSTQSRILFLRYIEFKSWDEISLATHYSRYWTQVIWRKAINEIDMTLLQREEDEH